MTHLRWPTGRGARCRRPARRRGLRRRLGERGAATAELAMVLPLLLAVTVGLVWLLAVGAAQVRTVDAAREAARAVARGDPVAEAVARGRRVAPPRSSVSVHEDGSQVTAVVVGHVDGPGGLFRLPGATVSADAVAVVEGVAAAAGAAP
jgi:Flp pilus assembly protein TadG